MTEKLNARKEYLTSQKNQLEAQLNTLRANEPSPDAGGYKYVDYLTECGTLEKMIEDIREILSDIETGEVE